MEKEQYSITNIYFIYGGIQFQSPAWKKFDEVGYHGCLLSALYAVSGHAS